MPRPIRIKRALFLQIGHMHFWICAVAGKCGSSWWQQLREGVRQRLPSQQGRVLIFPRPSRKPVQCHYLINNLFQMGKRVKNPPSRSSQLVVGPARCPDNPPPLARDTPEQPPFNFLHRLPHPQPHSYRPNSNAQINNQHVFLELSAANLIDFFNYQKYYSKIELDCYVICLANAINITRHTCALALTHEFKNKIRRFLQELAEEDTQSLPYSNKVRAIFYILVAFIYQERTEEAEDAKSVSRVLLGDRSIVRSILTLAIPRSAKISKFYGIIMLAITSRSHPKRVKEAILKSIFLNLRNMEHQPTFFNLLVYLRSEKNKVKINLKDLREGEIFSFLIEGYQKYIEQYQSYYILDYLNHLLNLFPSIAEMLVRREFISLLITNLRLRNMHHPMHETTILSFIGKGLKYLESTSKQSIVEDIYRIEVSDLYTQSKIAKIVVEHEKCEQLAVYITDQGYLVNFIESLTPQLEKNILNNCVELLLQAIKKLQEFNINLSRYLLWLLRHRTSSIDESVSRMVEDWQFNFE